MPRPPDPDATWNTPGSLQPLPTIRATAFVSTLRRGRSRPFVVEGDDGRYYVVKHRSTPKATRHAISEVIAGSVCDVLRLPQPDRAFIRFDTSLDAADLAPETRRELEGFCGTIHGTVLLSDARTFRVRSAPPVDQAFASRVVWADAFLANGDRLHHNSNLLVQQDRIYLIDHDNAMRAHHQWADPAQRHKYTWCPASSTHWWSFRDHCLLPFAGSVGDAGSEVNRWLTPDVIEASVDAVPDEWIREGFPHGSMIEPRETYTEFLCERLALRHDFESHADWLRARGISSVV